MTKPDVRNMNAPIGHPPKALAAHTQVALVGPRSHRLQFLQPLIGVVR